MKKLLCLLILIAGCAGFDTSLKREVTEVELTKYKNNTRLIIYAKNGRVESTENKLYIRFAANPVLSTQAEKTLKTLFTPCRYTGIKQKSITFSCLPSTIVYPECTVDFVDVVISQP